MCDTRRTSRSDLRFWQMQMGSGGQDAYMNEVAEMARNMEAMRQSLRSTGDKYGMNLGEL